MHKSPALLKYCTNAEKKLQRTKTEDITIDKH